MFLDFCKNQTLKSAILESVELLENKNYDGIKSITSLITPFSKIISEYPDSTSILPDNLLVNLEYLVKKHILEIHDSFKKELELRDITINKMVNLILKDGIKNAEYRFEHDKQFLTENN